MTVPQFNLFISPAESLKSAKRSQAHGMRVIVGVKRVVDYAVKVRVAADKTAVDLSSAKMSVNPFCEIAVGKHLRNRCGPRLWFLYILLRFQFS